MNITKIISGNEATITVSGGITASTVGEFDARLNDEIKPFHTNLILSLADVNYINSSGLRVILTIAKEYAARKLHFKVQCKRDVFQIFDTVGFSKIIKIDVIH